MFLTFPRFVAVSLAIVLGLGVVGVAAPAHAASSSPVAPVQDLPSRVAKVYYNPDTLGPPGSPSYDDNMADMLKKQEELLKAQSRQAQKGKVPFKPLSVFKNIGRVAKNGSKIGIAGSIGWMLGQAGLSTYSVFSGQSYEDLICSQPEWYQGVNNFFMFDTGPDCTARFPQLDDGEVITGGYLEFGDYKYQIIGLRIGSATGGGGPVKRQIAVISEAQLPVQYAVKVDLPPDALPGSTAGQVGSLVWGILHDDPSRPAWAYHNAGNDWRTNDPSSFSFAEPYVYRKSDNQVMARATPMERTTEKDLDRVTNCEVKWSDGSTTGGAGTPYREVTGMPVSSKGLGCETGSKEKLDDGEVPEEVKVTTTGSDGKSEEVHKENVPKTTPEEREVLRETSREGLVLKRGTKSCMTWEADCAGWWDATNSGTTGTEYKCTFGGKPTALKECGVYRYTFDKPTNKPTITVQEGTELGGGNTPITTREIEWITADEDMNSTNPGDSINPGAQCMSQWSSTGDPISWVLHPVKCALVWAFVPRKAEVDKAGKQIVKAWKPTMPGQIVAATTDALTPPAGLSGCMGPHVYIPMNIGETDLTVDWYPLAACEPPMSNVAATARVIGAAVLIFLTLLGIIRRASASVNAPGVGTATEGT
ncbi:hypothetical protein [Leucobacter sp.]